MYGCVISFATKPMTAMLTRAIPLATTPFLASFSRFPLQSAPSLLA